mgnify:CR=1 FL=1
MRPVWPIWNRCGRHPASTAARDGAAAVPRLVFAFGMLWAWLVFPIPIYGTLWLLLIAYLTVFLPLGLRTIAGVILQIDRLLEESAQMCGAPWGYRLRTVTMPLLKPFTIIITLLTLEATLKVFDLMLTMTNGGPFFSTEVVEIYIYRWAFAATVPQLGAWSVASAVKLSPTNSSPA